MEIELETKLEAERPASGDGEQMTMKTQQTNSEPLPACDGSERIGAEIGADDAWPSNLMCRLLLPVPVKELAAIGDALSKIAKKQGKEARMKQVGQTLEIFTVQNAENQAREPGGLNATKTP